jgi:hypothetical protein
LLTLIPKPVASVSACARTIIRRHELNSSAFYKVFLRKLPRLGLKAKAAQV